MRECVNCHRRVIPKTDGTCPTCRERVDRIAARGAEARRRAEQTLLTVSQEDRMPDVCCRCAQPTARREVFRFTKRTGGENGVVRFLLLAINPLVWFETRGVSTRLRLELPFCALCRSEGRLEPRDVRFENYTMEFEVHREFRREVEARRA